MGKWIEVIETDRDRNCAYIAFCGDDPYFAYNTEVKLDWVECEMGCIFENGSHPFIRMSVERIERL